jgi:chitodextrinase
VSPSSDYVYSLTATDASSNASPPATASVSTPGLPPSDANPPSAPASLTAKPASATAIVLAWIPGTDDQGVAGYRIERNGSVIAFTALTSWTDTHRAPSTTYRYAVETIDLASNLSPAATAVAKTPADTVRPTKPTTVHAKRMSSTRERLSWSRATDNVGVVRYIVYRVGRTKAVAFTTKLTITIHRVAGARYYVRAVDAHGNRSAVSNAARAV